MVTFLHRKVTPRRAGVQMNTFCKTPRRRQATANYPPPGRKDKTLLWFLPSIPPSRLRRATSLYTKEAMGWCDATSLPLHMGGFWVCRQARRKLDGEGGRGGWGAGLRWAEDGPAAGRRNLTLALYKAPRCRQARRNYNKRRMVEQYARRRVKRESLPLLLIGVP